ncbi:MAG: glutamine synthetase family protein, partial [Bacillota bacterium]
VQIAPEMEFFLFHLDQQGKPTTLTHDQGLYFDLSPLDAGEEARRDMVLALQKMGFQIEAAHHENSPGQHEIDFRSADPLTTADSISTFKLVVRRIAKDHHLHATFMPKPLNGLNGSGMHLHLSVTRGSKNLFFAPRSSYGISETAAAAIAGLLNYARPMTAVTNPLTNSYKRLVPGFEAPAYAAWSQHDRSPLIRIPSVEGSDGARIELRSPDPSCNPYLALAVVIKAMHDGIRRKLPASDPINLDLCSLSAADRVRLHILPLPTTLQEALNEMDTCELVRSALGEHLFSQFMQCKRLEWEIYNTQVQPWEVDQYLGKY